MRKIYVILALMSIFLVGNSCQAKMFGVDYGQVSLNATSSADVAPDTAEITFSIITNDTKSILTATAENKTISEKTLAQLKTLINEEKGDFIKTIRFNATPVYTYNNSKKVFEKYEVTNSILVHTKSIDKIGLMIDNVTKLGVTNVDNLEFLSSDYDTQCNKLIVDATQKVKNNANLVAKTLNSSVKGVGNINVSCHANNNATPRFYMAKNMIAEVASGRSDAFSNSAISNGLIKIQANVNANFYIK